MRVDLRRQRGQFLEMLHKDSHDRIATKWRDACGHFIEDNTERVQVAPPVARKPTRLFGRDIEGGTEHFGRVGRNSLQLGNAEVCEDRRAYSIPPGKALVKDDVGRFDVAMDHAFLMGIVKSEANRCEDIHYVAGGRKLSLARSVTDIISERRSFDIIHHHIGCGDAQVRGMDELKVVNLHDIGVVQRRNKLCFALETRGEIWIGLHIAVELLYSNIAS